MKIRFKTSIAARGWVYQPGTVIEVDRMTPFIAKLLRVEAAELVLEHDNDEVAVAPSPPNTTTLSRRERRRAARRAAS